MYNKLESSFEDIKEIFSAETLLYFLGWEIPLTVHTDESDKNFGYFISQNNKPIEFFSSRLSDPQHNYTNTDNWFILVLYCLNQFWGIFFGYKINLCSYHSNLVYSSTLSGFKIVILWILIINDFGRDTQNIAGVENIVPGMLKIFPSTTKKQYNTSTRRAPMSWERLFLTRQ